jgi:hypothetical protein
VGYLRCEGGPHLHEFVTGRRGGEAKLSLAVEVEFPDEMETCVSTGGRCGGATVAMDDGSMIKRGDRVFSPRARPRAYLYWQSCELELGSSFMKFPRAPISHLV